MISADSRCSRGGVRVRLPPESSEGSVQVCNHAVFLGQDSFNLVPACRQTRDVVLELVDLGVADSQIQPQRVEIGDQIGFRTRRREMQRVLAGVFASVVALDAYERSDRGAAPDRARPSRGESAARRSPRRR